MFFAWAAEIVGERWTLLIVCELLLGPVGRATGRAAERRQPDRADGPSQHPDRAGRAPPRFLAPRERPDLRADAARLAFVPRSAS